MKKDIEQPNESIKPPEFETVSECGGFDGSGIIILLVFVIIFLFILFSKQ